jgi:hypothetical protein
VWSLTRELTSQFSLNTARWAPTSTTGTNPNSTTPRDATRHAPAFSATGAIRTVAHRLRSATCARPPSQLEPMRGRSGARNTEPPQPGLAQWATPPICSG